MCQHSTRIMSCLLTKISSCTLKAVMHNVPAQHASHILLTDKVKPMHTECAAALCAITARVAQLAY